MDRVNNDTSSVLSPRHWLAVLCLFQLTLWTLAPNWVRNVPHSDTLEGITWGNLWQWGYDKHPPLAAWAAALFARLSDTSDLPVYFLAQLSIVIIFLAVWRLAREYLSPYGAVLAVFLLQGVLFYSNRVERVTPDTIQAPVWALLVLTFYFAVTRQSLVYWLLTGFLAGLAILAKYQAVVLFFPLLMILFITAEGRRNLKTPGPWLAALLGLLVIAPHIQWLIEHDFAAVGYLDSTYVNREQPRVIKDWSDRLVHPASFSLNSFNNVLPLLLLCIPLYRGAKLGVKYGDFKRRFLTSVALGPFLLTLVFGLFTGEDLISRWATPYFMWLPLYLLMLVKPDITYKRFRSLAVSCLILGLVFCSLRTSYQLFKPLYNEKHWSSSEYFPAKQEMAYAEALWAEHYDYPMPYIGGLHYHIAEIVPYKTDPVIPYLGLNPAESLWMNPDDFRRYGGLILIRLEKQETSEVLERLRSDYPEAEYLGQKAFKPVSRLSVEPTLNYVTDYYLIRPSSESGTDRKNRDSE